MLRQLLLGDTEYSQSKTSGTVAGARTLNGTTLNMVLVGTVIEDWGGSVLVPSTEFEIQHEVSGYVI